MILAGRLRRRGQASAGDFSYCPLVAAVCPTRGEGESETEWNAGIQRNCSQKHLLTGTHGFDAFPKLMWCYYFSCPEVLLCAVETPSQHAGCSNKLAWNCWWDFPDPLDPKYMRVVSSFMIPPDWRVSSLEARFAGLAPELVRRPAPQPGLPLLAGGGELRAERGGNPDGDKKNSPSLQQNCYLHPHNLFSPFTQVKLRDEG